MNLIIATFNVKDYGNDKEDKTRTQVIYDLVKKHKIDVLSLQEITPSLIMELKNIFNKNNYYVTEAFRMKDLNRKYNESNTIISRFLPLETKIHWLSNKPQEVGSRSYLTLYPRNVNITSFKIEGVGNLTFLNTHLDLISYTRIRQLKCLYNIIKEDKDNYFFLNGDFNTKPHRKYFISFINKLKELGLKHIENNQLTCVSPLLPYYNGTIDHIFIPESFKVITTKVISSNITDHKMIITNMEIPSKKEVKF